MFEEISQGNWPFVLASLALGLISLLVARRSQIDAWANANPRLAGVLKLMRALSIDPWMILQGLSLLIKGRMPAKADNTKPQNTPPPKGGAHTPVGLMALALLSLLLVACGPSSTPPPVTPPTSTLPPGDPCRLEAISVFAESCGADCDRNGGDVAACKSKCKSEIKERCAQ